MAEIEYIMAFMSIKPDSSAKYQEYKAEYNAFVESMNDEFVNLSLLAKSMLGM